MLSIESMLDVIFIVYLVQNPICVFRHRCCEDDQFIVHGKVSQEAFATGADHIEALILARVASVLLVMNKRLVEV